MPLPFSLYRELSSYDHVWVIADIHSCFYTLRKLTQQLPSDPQSLFIFLGDYINKGEYPEETLVFLLDFSLRNECIFLRGNHDQMLLDAWQTGDHIYIDQLRRLASGILIDQREKYQPFLSSTLHYVTTENFLLVHVGFDFRKENPFEDVERMMMIREINYDAEKASNRKLIRGHFPHTIENIRMMVREKENVISLDNGCVYPERHGMGMLLALELHSWILFEQRNID